MSMSKRDYEELAVSIAATLASGDYATLEEAACRIADACAKQNPRFDRGRFLTACGFGS